MQRSAPQFAAQPATAQQYSFLRTALYKSTIDTEVRDAAVARLDELKSDIVITDDKGTVWDMLVSGGKLYVHSRTLAYPDDKLASMVIHEMTHLSDSGANNRYRQYNILAGQKAPREAELEAFAVQRLFEQDYMGAGKGLGSTVIDTLAQSLPYAEPLPAGEVDRHLTQNKESLRNHLLFNVLRKRP